MIMGCWGREKLLRSRGEVATSLEQTVNAQRDGVTELGFEHMSSVAIAALAEQFAAAVHDPLGRRGSQRTSASTTSPPTSASRRLP